jgi:transposase
MRPLSLDRQNSIVLLLESGKSEGQVARELGISISTVSKYKKARLPDLQTAKGGRVSKLTDRDKGQLRKNILNGTWTTATEAHINLVREHHQVSLTSVKRALRSMGFETKRKIKKPFLATRHKKSRYEWAVAHKDWTVDDWRRVIFSDETKINLWGSDGCRYYWKRPGGPIRPHHLDLSVKHGAGSLMMWGCMTYSGIGYGCQIDGIMKAEDYCRILSTSFKDTLEYWCLDKDEIIFQQDNDPKHTSKQAKVWFKSEGIQVLPWPAQSPDLNPIEHLWRHLKLKLAKYERRAKGVHELWERCNKEWNEITPEECKKYIDSMPGRVQAVLRAKGGHTSY